MILDQGLMWGCECKTPAAITSRPKNWTFGSVNWSLASESIKPAISRWARRACVAARHLVSSGAANRRSSKLYCTRRTPSERSSVFNEISNIYIEWMWKCLVTQGQLKKIYISTTEKYLCAAIRHESALNGSGTVDRGEEVTALMSWKSLPFRTDHPLCWLVGSGCSRKSGTRFWNTYLFEAFNNFLGPRLGLW